MSSPEHQETTLETVLEQVTNLYRQNPEAFRAGADAGRAKVCDPAYGRDYFGLILGGAAIYEDYMSSASISLCYRLNDPSFAVGALLGAVGELPHGRFEQIVD